MGKTMLKLAGAVSCVLAMAGCGGGRIEKWENANSARHGMLKPGADLLGVTVPVLRARGLEQVWGAPKIQRDGEGGYCLTYSDPRTPFTRLIIHGMAEPLPKLSSPPKLGGEDMRNNNTLAGDQREREQEWRTVTVLEEKVRWYQESAGGGADGAYFSTEGFTLKAPDGRKGHYRLVAENGGNAAEAVARWFSSVSF
ncbi:hypothetical protein OKA05_25620 [Luteolibacter arcticus]|uniref:Lipoprotein n=1 Tax=Luteolibacter arcticus TaxID=1581411 RepID=A0ABT3GR19_9BACT|nr:hypothetical protein [Luteolibacter arcticus]MCW1925964.1 hypothetical protein [Luteolibacter arcticus]